MRLEFKRRVNLLQAHYRCLKFNEPLPSSSSQKVEKLESVSVGSDDEDAKREAEVWKALGGQETIARLKKIEEIN